MESAAEHVFSLRQRVAAMTAELHALQRELLNAEGAQRRHELHVLADAQGAAAGPQGLVMQQGSAPEASIARGFPTSRSEIQGERAIPVEMSGSVRVEPDEVSVFQIPRSRPIVSPPKLPVGETGKGPTLVRLFG